jgi:hypothetical protein
VCYDLAMIRSLFVGIFCITVACGSGDSGGPGPGDGGGVGGQAGAVPTGGGAGSNDDAGNTGGTPGTTDGPPGMHLGDGSIASFFQIDAVHQIDIIVPEAEWAKVVQENMNLDQAPTWHEANFRIDGVMASRVGFKTFGYGSRAENPAKPNLNLDFNRNVLGQSFDGIGKMRMKNNGQDASALRQAITYEAMRAVDLMAPRSTYAELSVNGQPFGFYFVEESFTKAFVKERTGNDDGASYEADDCQGFVPPVNGGCPALHQRYLRSFNELAGTGDDLTMVCSVMNGLPTDFIAGASAVIKLDEWVRAIAADTALAGDYDGFSTNGANFRLYHDTTLNRLRLVILGPDTTYDPSFYPDPAMPKPDDNCTIDNPTYHDVFLEKLLGTPEGLAMYRQAVQALRQGAMAPATLKARVDALWAVIGPHAKSDLHLAPGADPEASKEKIKTYLDLRDADLTAKGF